MGATSASANQGFFDDDLFSASTETLTLGGAGPFVINLSSSTVPASLPENGIPVTPGTRIYQIKRFEDQRVRYRLRLGPFATESQADAILIIVRDGYPAALTATATAEDLEAFADLKITLPPVAVNATPKMRSVAPTLTESVKTQAARPAQPPAAAPSVSKAPAQEPLLNVVRTFLVAPPKKPAVPTLTAEPPARAAAKPAATGNAALPAAAPVAKTPAAASPISRAAAPNPRAATPPPAVVNRIATPAASAVAPARAATLAEEVSITVAEMTLELETEAPAPRQSTVPARTQISAPVTRATEAPKAGASVDLESTQTMRALTSVELEDKNALRWFVIELCVAERAFQPDTVPDLDIFSMYRLYAVETADSGRPMHALRLGFFSEEMAAKTVAAYLGDHYKDPAVRRVSIAEHDRFKEKCLEARKKVEATGKHLAIEITDQRYVREISAISR
jgi:hypothetical protein